MYLDRAKFTALFPGIPSWMQGMSLGWDFTQNVQYSGATNPTDTHSATVYAQNQVGLWSPFAANTLVRTDLGLQTVPTRVQLCRFTRDVTQTGGASSNRWIHDAATVTQTNANSDAFVGSISNASGTKYPRQGTLLTASTTYTVSAELRLNGAPPSTVLLAGYTGAAWAEGAAITLTSSFVRHQYTFTTAAAGSFGEGAGFKVVSAGAFDFRNLQIEAASFAGAVIPNDTSSALTVNGNQQVVDLTGRLGSGVGLIMQFNPLDVTATFKQPISFNDGTSNNYLNVYMDVGGGTPLSQIVNATINQGNVTMPGANATGVQTWVIAAGPNYHRTQKIGQAASTTDTTVSWPTTLSKMNIGGNGFSAADNMYQQLRRLALRFGAANDAMFNDLVAKATILNAVS